MTIKELVDLVKEAKKNMNLKRSLIDGLEDNDKTIYLKDEKNGALYCPLSCAASYKFKEYHKFCSPEEAGAKLGFDLQTSIKIANAADGVYLDTDIDIRKQLEEIIN